MAPGSWGYVAGMGAMATFVVSTVAAVEFLAYFSIPIPYPGAIASVWFLANCWWWIHNMKPDPERLAGVYGGGTGHE